MLTLDVVVPTYRADAAVLQSILDLPVPAGVSTQFTVVCDRPGHPEAAAVMAALEKQHAGEHVQPRPLCCTALGLTWKHLQRQ